jgi:uncharacterized protein involved in exopolysaccharide biosynthesis
MGDNVGWTSPGMTDQAGRLHQRVLELQDELAALRSSYEYLLERYEEALDEADFWKDNR